MFCLANEPIQLSFLDLNPHRIASEADLDSRNVDAASINESTWIGVLVDEVELARAAAENANASPIRMPLSHHDGMPFLLVTNPISYSSYVVVTKAERMIQSSRF